MKNSLLAGLALGIFLIGFAVNVNATTTTTPFFDDFENGNALGWALTSSGSGSTSVEEHNESQMMVITHSGSGSHELTRDFAYSDDWITSFDMHAVAYSGGNSADGRSGVTISFLDSCNRILGDTGFTYATDGTISNYISINKNQHNYSGLMSEYAELANLYDTDNIAKINLSFFAYGEANISYTNYSPYPISHSSSSTVWVDNVYVGASAVPIPGAILLLGSGLLGLSALNRRQ